MNTRAFIERIYPPLAGEVADAMQVVVRHTYDTFDRFGLPAEHTTGVHDCALLYLLARHFRCTSILEAGTFIGASAVALAQAVERNGGVVTTCDVADWSAAVSGVRNIRFIHADCATAARNQSEVDLVFFDCVPNRRTIESLRAACRLDAILATHDYVDGLQPRRWSLWSKGRDTVAVVEKWYERPGMWFLPDGAPYVMTDGFGVNASIAFFIPQSLLAASRT